MGHVQRRSNGTWLARYRGPDGREHSKTFKRKIDADRFNTMVEAAKIKGDFVDPTGGKITFGDWVPQYNQTTQNLRPSTRVRDNSYISTHILPEFGKVRLSDITQLHVRKWVAELSAKGLAPATVQKVYQIMSKIMRAAVDGELIAKTPCRSIPLPKVERREMRFLNPAEVNRLAEEVPDRYRAFVLTAAYSGLRWGELVGLKVGKVDPLTCTLSVAEILVEVEGKLLDPSPPKTRAGRRLVRIPRPVMQELVEHTARYCEPGGYLFTSPEGGPLRKSFRSRVWVPAVKRAGLAPLRIHDLRHTAVSFWIAAGAHVKEICALAGHTSASVVLDRYGHILPRSESELSAKLERLYESGQTTEAAVLQFKESAQ